MRTILILLVAALSGCAVYNTPYTYPAVPVYVQPPVVYQESWPVRVLVPQPVPVAPAPQPSVIYEDNRQYHYHQQAPKKKP